MNTSKLSFLIIVALWMFSMMSCEKNGETISRNYTLPAFNRVAVQSDIDVNIRYSPTQSIKVTGADNLLSNLDMFVYNQTLIIKMKVGFYANNLVADLAIPGIEYAEVVNTHIWLDDFANLTDLQLKVLGSGSIKSGILVVSNKIDSYIGGSGLIELKGAANIGDVAIGGSGNYQSYDLLTNYSTTRIDGAGLARVNVANSLYVSISGSGNVYYKGHPTIQTEITGSGSVIDAN